MLDETLRQQIADHESWYHTLDLAPGVVTPGWFDTREVARKLPIPQSLDGKRCLDIGTFDGFWAYEMERRGAREVVAVDLLDRASWDWPIGSRPEVMDAIDRRKAGGAGFNLTRAALGSSVERRELSIYALDPDDIGRFDFIYLGSLLLHLQNPVKALEAVHSVCAGQLLSVDAYDIGLTVRHPRRPVAELDAVGRPWWWKPNLAGLRRMIEAAGFLVLEGPKPFLMPPGPGQGRPHVRSRDLRYKEGRTIFFRTRAGDPHASTLARAR
jgi:tRNA (mo5U34)-methyltransferase